MCSEVTYIFYVAVVFLFCKAAEFFFVPFYLLLIKFKWKMQRHTLSLFFYEKYLFKNLWGAVGHDRIISEPIPETLCNQRLSETKRIWKCSLSLSHFLQFIHLNHLKWIMSRRTYNTIFDNLIVEWYSKTFYWINYVKSKNIIICLMSIIISYVFWQSTFMNNKYSSN